MLPLTSRLFRPQSINPQAKLLHSEQQLDLQERGSDRSRVSKKEAMGPGWAVKAIMVIVVTSIFFRCVSAANHAVGGLSGWNLGSNVQAWADSTTFHAGDFLVFRYGPLHDVLEVSQSDFNSCRSINPISAYDDGETVVELRNAVPRYFICGRLRHCIMGLRLSVQVLASAVQAPAAPPNTSTPSATASSPLASAPAPFQGQRRTPRRSPPPPKLESQKPSPPPKDSPEIPELPPGPDGGNGDAAEPPYRPRKNGGGHCACGTDWLLVGWFVVLLAALD